MVGSIFLACQEAEKCPNCGSINVYYHLFNGISDIKKRICEIVFINGKN
jgi:transcription initiation factor IIE alpha subunit